MNSSLFRGEEVILSQIFIHSEAAYSCVAKLGELGLVQFRDLNQSVNSFQRRFVNDIRRCEEMERQLRFIENEIVKEEIKIAEGDQTCQPPKHKFMFHLESELEKLEKDLLEVNFTKDRLKRQYLELAEYKTVLNKLSEFFEEVGEANLERKYKFIKFIDNYKLYERTPQQLSYYYAVENIDIDQISVPYKRSDTNPDKDVELGFIAGVLNHDKVTAFHQTLSRVCKGCVFLKTFPLDECTEDPQSESFVAKTVFFLFFQGEILKSKCKKICDAYKATLYSCPESQSERRDILNDINSRLDELNDFLEQWLNLRNSLLLKASFKLKSWICKITKMKAIFHTLNMLKCDQKLMIAECWLPADELPFIRDILDTETRKIDPYFLQTIVHPVHTEESPPTYHKTNKLTAGFQGLVNAYGVPNYKEINPTPFTVITFPFLFAIMFGDAGHGLLVFLAALFIVQREKKLKNLVKGNEVFEIFYDGRYIILLMGLFSIYTGLIYNDFFSKSSNMFISSWKITVDNKFDFSQNQKFELNPNPNSDVKMYSGNPYVFGVDPIWQLATNKISFTNSMKMKFAIIIGVLQMMFGLVLGLFNHIHFKRKISIYFEFIPQILFISLIFFYLCLLIFAKWIIYDGSDDPLHGASCAPSLLIVLINMFFLKDSSLNADGTIDLCKQIYPYQYNIQVIFIILSLLCIPIMLLAKPLILYHRNKVQSRIKNRSKEDYSVKDIALTHIVLIENEVEDEIENKETEKFEMSEVMVEQTIHTIEYFLGCISHTASYLRLWALSLAHVELSEVAWKLLATGMTTNGAIMGSFGLFFLFSVWAVISIGILCLMEGLSAFLHALRLHWVEFQSKFYKGEGHEFVPFCFQRLIEN